jgi:hypothetical protein
MKVTVDQLDHLYNQYGEEVQLRYLNDQKILATKMLADTIILPNHVPLFRQARLRSIEVVYDPVSYQYLQREFPAQFRPAYQTLGYMDFDRHLEILERASLASHRERYVTVVGDIYAPDPLTGRRSVVLQHNDKVTYRNWNTLKRNLDRNIRIPFRNSEVAIIILVNLTMDAETEYVERFRKNTDLITIMVSNRTDYAREIAPDFIPTEDIISVTDPTNLLETYIESNARLIIIGENINESYKQALIKVKRFDKFVRMMVVPSIDHSNLDHFFKQMALVYNSDRW